MNTIETTRCRLCDIAKSTPCTMCARRDKGLCGGASRVKGKACPYYICRNFAVCYGRKEVGSDAESRTFSR